MYGFTIRGQVFQFSTREEYLAAFSNSLNIAQAQLKEREEPDPYRRPLKPPIQALGIELPQLEG